ncbi:MAG TPA: copper resistance system multicopper oxidase [Gammaproteobacteria bacterium]
MQNRKQPSLPVGGEGVTRRHFLQGLAAGGVLLGLGGVEKPVWAVAQQSPRQELRGNRFELTIGETPVNFTGKIGIATTVNDQLPAPLLRWREGDTVTLKVTNHLQVPTSIHWHGVIVPNAMDGVPGMTFDGIAPGESFTYQFPVRQSGTYWYHSHSGFQEQTGLYGPLIIEPREPAPYRYDREYVVMLSDWSDASPEHIYSRLKKMDGYYNYAQPTLLDFIRQARAEGWAKAFDERMMWDQMRMSPHDLADVSGATYTYLMNGTAPAGNWTALFQSGEKVLLRFINGAAMSYFDVRIPGLKMTVVAADGQYVQPVSVDEFRIAVAETYDVIVEPQEEQAYTLFAQSMDRSGYARGTLAPRAGMAAAVPALDPVPSLTMADMGMAMDGHEMHGMTMDNHGGVAGMPVNDGHVMDHSGHTMHDVALDDPHAGHDVVAMEGMDHGDHSAMLATVTTTMEHGSHATMESMPPAATMARAAPDDMLQVQRHPATERGLGSSMQASVLSKRLDDPGVGLRNNGRRVLTYADLRGVDSWLDAREPSRTIELHLTGNMARYMWSFDGVSFADAAPLQLKQGEVVRVVLVNDTMMEHPIHLHGMWSELEDPTGKFQVRKHTVSVKPGHAITYRVLAEPAGRWAYHCHLFFHMKGGMFREVRVS